jgi:type II secretory pathway pseudopilin PulG
MNMMKRIKKILRSQRGISLVETLVAVAILGTAVVAFVAALSTGVISTNVHGQEVTAQRLAQNQVESIKNQVFNTSGTYTIVSLPSGYTITLAKSAVPGANTDIQKITVTVLLNGVSAFTVAAYKVNR